MTTLDDLWTERLRAAVEDHPAATAFDPATYVAAGRRRRRRNQLLAAAGSALAVALLVVGATLATGRLRSDEAPVPPATRTPSPTATASGTPVPAGAPAGAFALADTGEGFVAVVGSGPLWRRDADGWHQLGAPPDSAGMVVAPGGQRLWTFDQESSDGGLTWRPLEAPGRRDPSCSPVPSVATGKVFLLMPRWCPGATPGSGGWQGSAYTQRLGSDRWQRTDLPALLQDANPGFGPARFLTVGDAIVATTDGRKVGHQYVVSRDNGASWAAPARYPCDDGDIVTDPDHTALLAVCPANQGSTIWRALDLTRWAKVADVPGIDITSGPTTAVPLGPETWLFVDIRHQSATLATPGGATSVRWPAGLGVVSSATIGPDLYVATSEIARNGATTGYGDIDVSRDGGHTWEPDR